MVLKKALPIIFNIGNAVVLTYYMIEPLFMQVLFVKKLIILSFFMKYLNLIKLLMSQRIETDITIIMI